MAGCCGSTRKQAWLPWRCRGWCWGKGFPIKSIGRDKMACSNNHSHAKQWHVYWLWQTLRFLKHHYWLAKDGKPWQGCIAYSAHPGTFAILRAEVAQWRLEYQHYPFSSVHHLPFLFSIQILYPPDYQLCTHFCRSSPPRLRWPEGKILGRHRSSPYFWRLKSPFIELDDGKTYRKALYLMVKTMVSCRFSLKPIHWPMKSSMFSGRGSPSHPQAWRSWCRPSVPITSCRSWINWGHIPPMGKDATKKFRDPPKNAMSPIGRCVYIINLNSAYIAPNRDLWWSWHPTRTVGDRTTRNRYLGNNPAYKEVNNGGKWALQFLSPLQHQIPKNSLATIHSHFHCWYPIWICAAETPIFLHPFLEINTRKVPQNQDFWGLELVVYYLPIVYFNSQDAADLRLIFG